MKILVFMYFAGLVIAKTSNMDDFLQRSPTILVNNMVLPMTRAPSSDTDHHFNAEYRYADGDLVGVSCINLQNRDAIRISYAFADKLSGNSIRGRDTHERYGAAHFAYC
ncbi:hypothetical protein B5X24_HaOG213778 [Helicoverpa armigera]|nr:hypothetical protein B5X24_HaOG213778 [Helicoverpa armigera]